MAWLALVAAAACAGPAAASSDHLPWLSPAGSAKGKIVYVVDSATRFHLHAGDVELPFGAIDRSTTALQLLLSPIDALTIDIAAGRGDADAAVLGNTSGDTDMRLGAAWRIVDEDAGNARWKPTLTVRAGHIEAGDYAADSLHALGTGRNGYEASVAVGKISERLSLAVEFGGRRFTGPVPKQSLLNVKIQLFSSPKLLERFLPNPNGFALGVGFHRQRSFGGQNMTSLAFPPPLLPAVQRDFDQVSLGAVLMFGGAEVAADAFRVLDARNSAAYNGVKVAISYNLDLARILGEL